MKKIIAMFVVLSLLLTGCSTQEKPKNKSVKTENTDKDAQTEKNDSKSKVSNDNKIEADSNSKEVFEGKPINHDVYYDAYKSIIEGYASYAASGEKNITDKNYNLLALMLFNNSNDPNKVMKYTFYDINNDNVAELLIRNEAEHVRSSPFAVYTLDNGNPKRVFAVDTLAERSYIQFFKNGNILIQGSGGAFSGGISIHRLENVKEVTDKNYIYQLDKYPEEYFTEDRSEVVKFSKFKQITQEWQPIDIDKLDWRPIK